MKKKPVSKKSSKNVSKKTNKLPTIDVTELERVYGGRFFKTDGTKGGVAM